MTSNPNSNSTRYAALREDWGRCPLCEPDDKLAEALFFLHQMALAYHDPDPFRWNLNAFLQSLRSVTFFLQKALAHTPGFGEWYGKRQDEMRGDVLLRAFVDGRTIVVHQRNLYFASSV